MNDEDHKFKNLERRHQEQKYCLMGPQGQQNQNQITLGFDENNGRKVQNFDDLGNSQFLNSSSPHIKGLHRDIWEKGLKEKQ